MHQLILMTVASAVMLGVLGQVAASITKIPAIVFLLIFGILAGPFGLGAIEPVHLGEGLRVLTSLFVAIILFEGGLSLRPQMLVGTMLPVRRLVTAGAAITFLGATVLARYTVGLPWANAFVFGSLVIVTGPTVIAPILKRVRLRPRLHTVLKSESILIDAVGVIVAVVVLEYVVAREPNWQDTLQGFTSRVGIGALVGAVGGGLAALAGRFAMFHRKENEHLVHLSALAFALLIYATAEYFYHETGVLAVTVAGLILAAAPIPFRQELEKFKDQLGTLGVSVLFILLSANLNLAPVLASGWREVALLAGMIFLVRPLSVWISTAGTVLDTREKLFIGLLAPRGIVAAAMASYFARRLHDNAVLDADRVETLVFMVIAATVFIEGAWAGPLAKWLKVAAERPSGVLLVGMNAWSLKVAEILQSAGIMVGIIDSNANHCRLAEAHGFDAYRFDATDPASYDRVDMSKFGQFVAMTPNDAVNTLACEAASPLFGERFTSQVMSKTPADASRSSVKMSGHWAMPCAIDHAAVCRMLEEGTLEVATLQLSDEAAKVLIASSASPSVIPVLISFENEHIVAAKDYAPRSEDGSLTVLTSRSLKPAAEDDIAHPASTAAPGSDDAR